MAYSRDTIPSNSVFNRNLSKSELNAWQAENLQMDDYASTKAGEAVKRVVQTLQREVPWIVEKVVLGGSLGKGTAIKGAADVDCVVFLRDFSDMNDFKRKIDRMIDDLNDKFLTKSQEYRQGKIQIDGKTAFASKFKLLVDGDQMSVDLLPAFDNVDKKGARNVFEEMMRLSPRDQQQYSSSFVDMQVDFVKHQPVPVKNLIRLVKHWRKTCFTNDNRRLPTSYPLELIAIKLWEKAGRPNSFDLRQGLKAVAQALVDYPSLDISWPEKYGTYARKSYGEPFILDPANPHNNVAKATDSWSDVARSAHEVIQSNLLRGITVRHGWN